MNDEVFAAVAADAAERLVAHWRALAAAELPVVPSGPPGTTLKALPEQAPEKGEDLAEILDDTWRTIVPQLVHWQHPGFLGWFPTNNSPASVLAELVTAGLGVQGMMWSSSPGATELEQRVCDWLARALALPQRFQHASGQGGGVIQDSASSAVLVAVVAALNRASVGRWRAHGTEGRYRVYCTAQTNSSVPKAVRIAGAGEAVQVPLLPGTHEMDPAALAARMDADRSAGLIPAAVVATVGTTTTCATDPVPEIGAVCQERGVWLHVDAAYAGSAALCPEFRDGNAGLGHADSYAVNAHKWMRTGIPCDVLWVADHTALTDAVGLTASYLRNPASESRTVVDFKDWQVPLGRPMRALKLWYVMRAHGLEGLREAIRHDVSLAVLLARLIEAEGGFEVVVHRLGLVVFRRDTDARTRDLVERLTRDPVVLCTPATVDGRPVLRAALGSPYTDEAAVHRIWSTIRSHAAAQD
ncbi:MULTISPECIES: pyridoxal phosphate-dependent decarboxylase family protein [Streptomyces]|uniref:Pyridoxal phosphate-dependent decarboxylase family protein n=1 Tax=Streptomyces eurythermus TaxID=42237 RepID=A0ABW6Z9G9_9ACTN|nr:MULTISPECIES: pyridoxal-dependent decarboxylase [Streptomyces]QIS68719.1 aspartate aminotransferase family protein [Streptomyces sp. DSM 40868]